MVSNQDTKKLFIWKTYIDCHKINIEAWGSVFLKNIWKENSGFNYVAQGIIDSISSLTCQGSVDQL